MRRLVQVVSKSARIASRRAHSFWLCRIEWIVQGPKRLSRLGRYLWVLGAIHCPKFAREFEWMVGMSESKNALLGRSFESLEACLGWTRAFGKGETRSINVPNHPRICRRASGMAQTQRS